MAKTKTKTPRKTTMIKECRYMLMSRIKAHANVLAVLDNPQAYIPVDDMFMTASLLNIPVPTMSERKKYVKLCDMGIDGKTAVKVVNYLAREQDETGELAKLPDSIFMSLKDAKQYMAHRARKTNHALKVALPKTSPNPMVGDPTPVVELTPTMVGPEVDIMGGEPVEQLEMNEVPHAPTDDFGDAPFPQTRDQAAVMDTTNQSIAVDTTNIEGMGLLTAVNDAFQNVVAIIPHGNVSIDVDAGDGFTISMTHNPPV